MPGVIEAARADFWLSKGALRDRYEGARPTPQLMEAIELFCGEKSRTEEHRLNSATDK